MKKIHYFAGVILAIVVSGVCFSAPVFACDKETEEDTTQEEPEEEIVEDIVYSDAIYLTELLPNPSGEESTDEFIELFNDSDEAVDLSGWELSDATSKTYTLSGTIGVGQHYAIYRDESGIALNNSGDTVELFQPDGNILDVIDYTESADDDVSYALDSEGEWQWTTTPTPGWSNSITGITEDIEVDEDIEENNDTSDDSESEDETTNEDEDTMQGYDFSENVIISELLPDPEGSDATDEWIELHNTGSKEVNVYGWQIADPSKTFTLAESYILAADEYALFYVGETKISLNNSGDTVYLYDPASELMDEVTYEDADSGMSYARINDSWEWTNTPTPGESNVATVATVSAESATASSSSAIHSATRDAVEETEEESTGVISIAAAKQFEKGDDVIIEGIVNVTPGTFGTQYFYIQDDSGGMQVYSSKKDFPEIEIGDFVRVTGTLSEANGETKLNISSAEDIFIQSTGSEITVTEITEYDEAQLGQLVQVSGEVTEKSGSTIVLDAGWNVYVKRSSGVSTTMFTEGEHITVIGVLTSTNDGIRVLPRSEADVITLITETESEKAALSRDLLVKSAQAAEDDTNTQTNMTTTGSKPIQDWWWLFVIVLAIIGLTVLSRSQKLGSVARNWLGERARVLAIQLNWWVGLEKNATDSKNQNQHHEQPPLGKTRL